MSPKPSTIELVGVTKCFGSLVALEQTDLVFEAGKTTILIGPSGCGKSTILRLIVGLLQPTAGLVRFEDRVLSSETILSLRRRMGYVIQEGGLFPHLTARQNILLLATHLRQPQEEMRARLAELCELTRLASVALSRYPLELSGGQRQRVSLIRALMLRPDVLLLDEPLAALDPMVRANLQMELKAIFQQICQTVIFVTHDLAEAAWLGDQIVLLRQGRVVQSGTFAALRRATGNQLCVGIHQCPKEAGTGMKALFAFFTGFLLASAAPASSTAIQPAIVGSKKFTESYVLADIAQLAIERAGFPAEHRQGMGGTIILWEALKEGAITCYPEYTGTIREVILKTRGPTTEGTGEADVERMRQQLAQFGVGMTGKLGFNNTYALVMRREQARRWASTRSAT